MCNTRPVAIADVGPAGDSPGPRLLCITPSPAVDRTARVPRLVIGEVLRPTRVAVLPGGKGVNAARVARRLGARVVTTGIAGGHVGRWLVEELEREGLAPRFTPAAAETRTTYVTVDDAGASVIVYEQPAPATEDELEAFLDLLVRELLPMADRAIVAGSLPAGVQPTGYARVVHAARAAGVPLLVDASGEHLRAALSAGPDLVKVGLDEVIDAGLVTAGAGAAASAEALVRAGATLAIVTDGPRPAAASDGRRILDIGIPDVEAVNAVGSGDAVNAGLSLALARGDDLEAALALGIAAGSANAVTFSGGDVDPALVEELRERVVVAAREPVA
jgi:tagatose 6-phosphate kinase